jgi:hypothetical protein
MEGLICPNSLSLVVILLVSVLHNIYRNEGFDIQHSTRHGELNYVRYFRVSVVILDTNRRRMAL